LIITKIKRIRSKRAQYNVFLDDGQAIELSSWTIGKFGLCTGDKLDEQTFEKIKRTEQEIKAKNIAVNYISYRPRSSKEIIVHLTKKGFESGCAQNVARQLESIKMIDDKKFAYAFARDRIKKKPIGQALLRRQLLMKGIPAATADNILAELITPQIQQASALQAAKRKIQSAKRMRSRVDPVKQKKRVLDFLIRRGFSYEIAMKTVHTTMDN
jgi:regulatory protein